VSRIDEALRRLHGRQEAEPRATPTETVFQSERPNPAGEPAEPIVQPPDSNAVAEPERGVESPHVVLEEPESRAFDHAASVTISSEWRSRLATGPDSDHVLVEQFRRLAGTLHHARQLHGLRSVMITSANPGDGKTMASLNLSLVLAQSYGYRVLLIDADLRRPSISKMVDLPEGVGLGEALRSKEEQKLALAQLAPRLMLLPAGRPVSNSIEALVSPRMRTILDEATAKFDWVILDAPPVGWTSDARLLSQMVGGTLFVIRASVTQHPDVLKGIDVVGRDQILGVVLNDVVTKDETYYGYGYGYGPKQKP